MNIIHNLNVRNVHNLSLGVYQQMGNTLTMDAFHAKQAIL